MIKAQPNQSLFSIRDMAAAYDPHSNNSEHDVKPLLVQNYHYSDDIIDRNHMNHLDIKPQLPPNYQFTVDDIHNNHVIRYPPAYSSKFAAVNQHHQHHQSATVSAAAAAAASSFDNKYGVVTSLNATTAACLPPPITSETIQCMPTSTIRYGGSTGLQQKFSNMGLSSGTVPVSSQIADTLRSSSTIESTTLVMTTTVTKNTGAAASGGGAGSSGNAGGSNGASNGNASATATATASTTSANIKSETKKGARRPEKPPISYINLIAKAIRSSTSNQATLNEIYSFLQQE